MSKIIPFETKMAYLDGRACPGCGLDPEVIAWYKRGDQPCGWHCTCGAIVIDFIVVGGSALFY